MTPVTSVFVSYTQADAGWAKWIAWELEDAGFSVRIQAWDAKPGGNFIDFMDRASKECDRTLAVLSPDYLQSEWARMELNAAVAQRKLLLVRVRDTALEGLLSAEIYLDLVGLSEQAATTRVVSALRQERQKPRQQPSFPRHAARPVAPFPGRGIRFGVPRQAAFFSGRHEELRALERAFDGGQRAIVTQAINVISPDQLETCSPTSGNGHLLVTSRHRGLQQFGAFLTLDVFDDATSEEFLLTRAKRPDERAAARDLVHALGGLPLALAHAGAYCAEGTSFAAYRALLTALPARELFDENPEVFYRETVASTWQVSIDAAAELSELAPTVLAMAAFLAPEKIPLSVFEIVLVNREDPREQRRLHRAVAALQRFSLADSGAGGLDVHRLLQKVVRDRVAERNDTSGAELALEALALSFPDPSAPASWPTCEALVSHVMALAKTSSSRVDSEALVDLLVAAFEYSSAVGDADRGEDIVDTSAQLAERFLGPGHHLTLLARSKRAFFYRSVARIPEAITPDAITLQERVLADSERLLGDDHPDTLTSRSNLALSYSDTGRTQDAITLQEQVLDDSERVLGGEHPNTLTARGNLALSYGALGRIQEAVALEQAVLADSERLLGPEHPDTLTARANLASSYHAAGRVADAITLAEEVLAERERVHGPEHPDTLTARDNVAMFRDLWETG